MLDVVIIMGLIIDVIAAFMMYYGKIFRSAQTIEEISTFNEYEIKHRMTETRLARLGAILMILGFIIQIIGYIINIKVE
jgi:hypothetical protein